MNIHFDNKTAEIAIQEIQAALEGRALGKLVSFDLKKTDLRVTIKKLGKSYLEFTGKQEAAGTTWQLKSEKIALSHRAFKSEVLEKLTKIISSIGGQVSH